MSAAFSLPDLDALDHAALKAMILAQQDQYWTELEQHAAMLGLRTSEIERLVEKLQRGTKSEKDLRQTEQLELRLEELYTANAVKDLEAAAPAEHPPPRGFEIRGDGQVFK